MKSIVSQYFPNFYFILLKCNVSSDNNINLFFHFSHKIRELSSFITEVDDDVSLKTKMPNYKAHMIFYLYVSFLTTVFLATLKP